jgi:hypothetical protein
MLPRVLQMDGLPNPNLPLRSKFPIKKQYEPAYRGPWDVVWTEGPNGEFVRVNARRHTSPRIKRATLRFRGPWKRPRF